MPRKSQRAATVQPPQITGPLAEPEGAVVIEPRTSYTNQRWHGQRFESVEAEDVSFEHIDMRSGGFQGASLALLQVADCRFDAVDFANCTLDKAYLRRVELLGCRMIGAQLNEADLQDVRLVRCGARLLRGWNMRAAAVRFEQCQLPEASFEGANLAGAVFQRCDLSGADFRNANLAGTDLRGSTLTGVRVNPKDLKGAIIDPAQAMELIQLLGVQVLSEDEADNHRHGAGG